MPTATADRRTDTPHGLSLDERQLQSPAETIAQLNAETALHELRVEAAELASCLSPEQLQKAYLRAEADRDERQIALTKAAVLIQRERGDLGVQGWPEPLDLVEMSSTDPQPPQFIIPDWLPVGYAMLFAGHGGVGKSGIALILAVCMALGLPFFGIPVERRRVLYLSCEDRKGVLHWRLSRICDFLGVSIADLAGWLNVMDLVGNDTILYQPGRDCPAYGYLKARMIKAETQVLFVDGISDTYNGNENSRAEVKAYVNALLALIPPNEGAVALIGHVGKMTANTRTAEGYSGSTGWHNSVRARWYLYPESSLSDDGTSERTGDLVLELQKSNLGPTDQAMTFTWDDSAGLFVGSTRGGESHFDRKYRDREETEGIVAAFRTCTDYVPAATMGPRTAYHVLSAQPNFPDSLRSGSGSRKRFWRHIENLRAMRTITETSITRKSDRTKVRILSLDADLQECSNVENDFPAHSMLHAPAAMQQCNAGGYGGITIPAPPEDGTAEPLNDLPMEVAQ